MNTKALIFAAWLAAAFAADAAPTATKSAQAQPKQDKALKLLERGDNLYRKQHYAEAVKLYRQGAEQYPSLPLFDMRLGEMYLFATGVEKDAEQAYKRLYEAYSNIFVYGDPYRIEQQNEISDNLRYMLGKAGVETGTFLPAAIGMKTRVALFGHQQAYDELPDDLRAMYAEHIRPPDPDGKTQWHDANLKFAQERMGTVFSEDGRKLSSWTTIMQTLGNSFLLGIAYEHGIGVPKNRIAAQALRLYARETWRQHGDQRREGHFWLLNDLSATEQAEAENLAQRLLALSREHGDTPVPKSSAVLDEVRKFAGQ